MSMKLNTVNIKGTEYVTVNERIKAFWKYYPNGRINTTLLSNDNGVCVFKAEVYAFESDTTPRATGYAYEKESSSFINKTSYIENCETSAVGRALGIFGIGIDTSVASADEVATAIENQKKIDATKVQALQRVIDNCNIPATTVNAILNKYNYKKLDDIMICDFTKVWNAISSFYGTTTFSEKGANVWLELLMN